MAYELKIEKTIKRPVSDVFNALKSGLLFTNCSAESSSMKIDFRVGGKYRMEFKAMGKEQHGEFLEIETNKRIVFTWCQNLAESNVPDTRVTIDLSSQGSSTQLVLQHTGFKDQATCENHRGGWTSGLNDMSTELEVGQLRMVRPFPVSVSELFEACKNPATFFGYMGDAAKGRVDFKVGGKYDVPNDNGGVRGEFLEIIPAQKITLSWKGGCGDIAPDSRVTLILREKPKGSSLELIHSGLLDGESQMSHRQGWEHVTAMMREELG